LAADPPPAALRGEDGTGLISLSWGVLAFLTFLLFTVHIAVGLYATSTVSAVGHDAARRVALAGGSPDAVRETESWLEERLGSGLDVEQIVWSIADGRVSLQLSVRRPHLLLGPLAPGGDVIERTFIVRVEKPVAA